MGKTVGIENLESVDFYPPIVLEDDQSPDFGIEIDDKWYVSIVCFNFFFRSVSSSKMLYLLFVIANHRIFFKFRFYLFKPRYYEGL